MNPGFEATPTAILRGSNFHNGVYSKTRAATLCQRDNRNPSAPCRGRPGLNNKPAIRSAMRTRRAQLSKAQQAQAAAAVARQIQKHPGYRRAVHIAAYIAGDGEIDPLPLLRRAQRRRKRIYLPVVQEGRLRFCRFLPGLSALHRNHLGIPEPRPRPGHTIDPCQLDLVLLPLVAFDRCGHRLGMGGGYYDRTFAFLLQASAAQGPSLMGVAHHFQDHPGLPKEAWDVPLDSIATDRALIRTSGRRGAQTRRRTIV